MSSSGKVVVGLLATLVLVLDGCNNRAGGLDADRISVDDEGIRLSTMESGEVRTRAAFVLTNSSNRVIAIEDLAFSCSCSKLINTALPIRIEPGLQSHINFEIALEADLSRRGSKLLIGFQDKSRKFLTVGITRIQPFYFLSGVNSAGFESESLTWKLYMKKSVGNFDHCGISVNFPESLITLESQDKYYDSGYLGVWQLKLAPLPVGKHKIEYQITERGGSVSKTTGIITIHHEISLKQEHYVVRDLSSTVAVLIRSREEVRCEEVKIGDESFKPIRQVWSADAGTIEVEIGPFRKTQFRDDGTCHGKVICGGRELHFTMYFLEFTPLKS